MVCQEVYLGAQTQRQSLEISVFGEPGSWNLFSSMTLHLAVALDKRWVLGSLKKKRLEVSRGIQYASGLGDWDTGRKTSRHLRMKEEAQP